jgi:hypothetical protein
MARREGRCPQSPGMIAVRNLKVQKRPLAETSGRGTTLTQASATLFPLRTLTGIEPVVIAPAGVDYWHTTRRLKDCEVYALPLGDCSALMTPFAWLAFPLQINRGRLPRENALVAPFIFDATPRNISATDIEYSQCIVAARPKAAEVWPALGIPQKSAVLE